MDRSATAHVDPFCREHLPPRHLWPQMRFDLPELRYRRAAQLRATRCSTRPSRGSVPTGRACAAPAWTGPTASCCAAPTRSRTCSPGPRPRARQPRAAARAQRALARGVLAGGAQGRLRRRRDDADAALGRARHHRGARAAGGRAVPRRLPRRAAATMRTVAYPDDLAARAARHDRPFPAVATAADDVALLAFTSGTTGRPKATMHFHRDVLAIADTFSRCLLRIAARRRRHRHPADRVHVRARRPGRVPAARRARPPSCFREPPRRSSPTRSPSTRSPCCPRRPPPTGRSSPPAAATGCAGCGARCRPGRRCPPPSGTPSTTRPALRIIDGIGSTEMLHVFIAAADDDIRPGSTGRAVPGYRAAVLDDDGRPVPDGTARPPRGAGPDRLPLPGRRPAGDLRPARLELHRRHLRPRRRRLLLVPRPQRRHDHLVGLQHLGAGGRAGAAEPSRRRRLRGGRGAGRAARRRRARVRRAPPGRTARRRRRCRSTSRRTIAPYKYPRMVEFVDVLPRTDHRQAAALPAARAGRDGAARRRSGEGLRHRRRAGRAVPRRAADASSTPAHEITVWERNAPDDTFGFGVVFSDETLGGIEHADPVVLRRDAAATRPAGTTSTCTTAAP